MFDRLAQPPPGRPDTATASLAKGLRSRLASSGLERLGRKLSHAVLWLTKQ